MQTSSCLTPLQRDPNPCRIIGVLDDGAHSLSATALAYIQQADVVIAGTRLLDIMGRHCRSDAQTHDLTGQLKQIPDWVRRAREANHSCVVLATGDPLCHGIARYLIGQLCAAAVEVLPNVSTIQLACARLGMSWQQAHIASIHSKDTGEWQLGATPSHGMYALVQAVRQHSMIALLTSPANSPDRVARMLLAEGLADDFRMAVAEKLCTPEEAVYADLTPETVADTRFNSPNVVLLWRTTALPQPVLMGLPDHAYQQRKPEKGLITKREIRAMSLARMQLTASSIVWDIGAGSGSVGLEAAQLCPQGHVFAIEKNADDVAIAQANQRALGISNYTLTHGKAPDGMADWDAPDAVFIGGSGGNLTQLIPLCLQRLQLQGWLVMNFVTLENLHLATSTLAAAGVQWDVVQTQASRSKPILHMHRMAAENPVWTVCAQKTTEQATTEQTTTEQAQPEQREKQEQPTQQELRSI